MSSPRPCSPHQVEVHVFPTPTAGVKGFKFDGSEVTGAAAARDAQRRSYELGAGIKTIEDIVAEEGA